jgi:endonuclease/exonuclease/phosphatase family metal-dependent hydrolase
MKIVSWNCKAVPPYDKEGFTKEKADYIGKYHADIYVIQECTNYDIEHLNDFKKNSVWYGDNLDSKYGIGIFSDTFSVELLGEHNPEYRYVVPYKVSNGSSQFTLFAVWTKDKNKNNEKVEYTEQTWGAINFDGYKKFLEGPVMLTGDFNSNNYWDKEYTGKKLPSHNDIIKKLKGYNIESAYHKYYNCENGNEKDPTLLWQMDINKKYHIDYCFVSDNFKIKIVSITDLTEWSKIKYSDHCPLIIEFE